jgi:lactate dehydrogenase-like 2-hydroxyacid dehydrogenase
MPRPAVLMIGAYPDADTAAMAVDYELLKLWEAEDFDALIAEHGGRVRAIATRGDLGASAALMERLARLEIVACFGVGVDAIDLDHARARGVAVTNTPDVLTEDVADLALALMLATARALPQGDRLVRAGAWGSGAMPLGHAFHGSRVGVVGMGRIGVAIARRAEAFGCSVAFHNRSPRPDLPYSQAGSLAELARGSDYLVLAVPGGPGTERLIGREVLDALGPEGVLINIARGSVVDEAALIDALERGAIQGAGLDVFVNEPEIDPRFLSLENTVLQPHRGSATVETRRAMGALVRENLAAHFAGRPLKTPVL